MVAVCTGYVYNMDYSNVNFQWSEEKDAKLRFERGIGFEDIVRAIRTGGLLGIDGGRPRYPTQLTYIVKVIGYVYLVPYVDQGDYVFLKTIFPSRVYRKIYASEFNDDE